LRLPSAFWRKMQGMGFGGAPLAGVAGKFIRRHSGLYRSRVFPKSIL
jgi:hypothetical protein